MNKRKQKPESNKQKPGTVSSLSDAWKPLGTVVQVLLPSIKMKSYSSRGVPFEKEFHDFLLANFDGYTVASGNITGFWKGSGKWEECNEHREYQIAVTGVEQRSRLEDYVGHLAGELKERTIFCTMNGSAFLIRALTPRSSVKRSYSL